MSGALPLLGKAPRGRGKAPDAEIKLQKDVCDAITAAGNAAHQLNNRFIKGLPDLLIKLFEYEAMLLECKLNRFDRPQGLIDVDLKPLQYRTLRHWHDRGMCTGVLSFVHTSGRAGDGGGKRFRLFTFAALTRAREFYTKRSGEEAARFRTGLEGYASYKSMDDVCAAITLFAEAHRMNTKPAAVQGRRHMGAEHG